MGVVDSPPRVFNSPYTTTTTSMEYNPMHRMSDFKVCHLVSCFCIFIDYFICLNFSILSEIVKAGVWNAYMHTVDPVKKQRGICIICRGILTLFCAPPLPLLQGGLSPATSEMNLYSFNSRSTSPVCLPTPTLASPRHRFSAYDSLVKRRTELNNPVCLLIHTHTHTHRWHTLSSHAAIYVFPCLNTYSLLPQVVSTHYSMRSATLGGPNKKDYIEELTKQLDTCQKVGVIWFIGIQTYVAIL